jgi:aspartate-semialdehyde dehydrogenase
VSVGGVRHGLYERSLQFVALSRSTIRGASGGAMTLAELLAAEA